MSEPAKLKTAEEWCDHQCNSILRQDGEYQDDIQWTRAIQRNAMAATACMCCSWCGEGLPRTLVEDKKGPMYIHAPDGVEVPCFSDEAWRYLDKQFPAQAGRDAAEVT